MSIDKMGIYQMYFGRHITFQVYIYYGIYLTEVSILRDLEVVILRNLLR